MNTAVRYYSRSGNTKLAAEAIADALNVKAVSVDAQDASLSEKTDVLFIGGALYAYGLDKHLKEYIQNLDPSKVGKAVLFSTSWLSKHSLDLMRKALEEKGIRVEKDTFYARNRPNGQELEDAKQFALKMAK